MIRFFRRAIAGIAVMVTAAFSNMAHAKFVFPYNHPDLEWYSIETEHFVVHYPQSKNREGNEHDLTGEWSARKMAQVAEESWHKMCSEFNYYLKERVHIVLINQGDELQGFTIPSWDWIEISANPGGSFYRGRGRMEWISDVFVHEFAHVVSLKANAAHSEGSQGVLMGGLYQDGLNDVDTGVEFFIMDGDSVFWTEGGAEYWSDNTGYNWWTASRDQNIRMTVLEDRLLEYKEWHTRAGKRGKAAWNDHERYYQQGYSFGLYLRQRFGHETYASFALEFGKKWRVNWESVIEDVLGIDAETLYWDWREYITERYEAQYERVKERGEVNGKEVYGSTDMEWLFRTPEARDEFMSQKRWEREWAKEKTGTYQWEPRISPDGQMGGVLSRGNIVITPLPEDMMFQWTGYTPSDPERIEHINLNRIVFGADFEHGWDFVPGQDAIVLTGREDEHPRSALHDFTGIRFEADGYNWKQLYYYGMPTREKKIGNRTVETRERKGRILDSGRHQVYEKDSWYAIPNTKRGSDPSVSPDGREIAFFEYTDGVLNLVLINIDGNDKRYLTSFNDGTWMQTVDWSPDGEQLVFAIFRNHMQNLYIINKDGSGLRPIMWDAWEELDAHWAHDGKIYFSAEPDGIFNIYSYDPKTEDFLQITNVIAGAMTPQISPDGHMLYTYYTAHGWKLYGLAKDQFMNAPANHLFNTEFVEQEVEEALAYREDLSHWAETTHKYRPHKSLIAPSGLPMFRLENDSRTNIGLQAGFQVFVQDFVEKHGGVLNVMLGEDLLFLGQYFYQGWYPTIMLTAYHFQVKYDAGYILDDDQDPATTDDQEFYEIRQTQYSNIANASIYYPWNGRFITGLFGRGMEFGFKGVDDAEWVPYLQELEVGLFAEFSNNSYFARSANPTRGRTVSLTYNHAWTDIVFEPYGGWATDDGQVLDDYEYNKYEGRWTENIPMPTLGGIPFLQKARSNSHVLQLDTRLGWVDRNVDGQDEFRAGGQHPYFFGNGTLRPNTQFAGYPGFSLSGETMAIMNLAWRFPIDQYGRHKIGPLYVYGIYGQIGGTAGNLWSFQPPSNPDDYYRSRFGERIAYDPNDIIREGPFKNGGMAYKNGNSMLYDLSAELRVQSVLFHGATWDSFLRLAYGFQEVRGYGDVDGDNLFDTSDNALGDELSNETEPAGLRVYIGLGTGW